MIRDFGGASNKLIVRIGYLISYIIFTSIVYLMLSFLNKIPHYFSIYHIAIITFAIVILGELIKRYLK